MDWKAVVLLCGAAMLALVIIVINRVSVPADQPPPAVEAAPLVAAPAVHEPPAPPTPDLSDAEGVRTNIRTYCEADYPSDLSMRAACKRNAEEGLGSYRAIRERYADRQDMQRALAQCLDDYTSAGVTDFSMVGACARNHEEGLKEMER